MRLTVIHDVQGNIESLAASPPDSAVISLSTKPGQRVTEVEAPELTADQDPEAVRKFLSDLIRTRRVEIEGSEGKLAKKDVRSQQ